MNNVDVLAVMDITNDAMKRAGAPGSTLREEARAAVAELIEAELPRWIDLLESPYRADPARLDAMLRQMVAALTRVQGGAA